MRSTWEQVERQHFLDTVAETFPFSKGCRDFVGAAENVEYADGLAHSESADDTWFSSLARRIQEDAFRFAGDRPRKSHLHERFVNLSSDELVVFLQESCRCLSAINRRTFPFYTENGFCGFAEGETEKSVTAVKIQKVVALFKAK